MGLAVSLAACGSSNEQAAETWKVGLEAPLTGDLATLGQGMLNGARLAAEQRNANGGVLGRDIEIVPIDDGGSADTGVAAANAAIAAGLDGVVGPYNSGVGIETLPLYIDAGLVPMRLTSDTATAGMGFTLQPMSNQIAPVMTSALTDFYDAERVAIAYDSTQNYTTSVAEAVRQGLRDANVTVTDFVEIQPGQSSYSDVISGLKSKNPRVVYAAVYYPEGAKFAEEIGDTKCLLDYASYDNGYIEQAGAAAKNCQVGGVPAPSDFEGSSPYVQAYQASFNQPPGTWSPYTYDSVNLLLDAVAAVGSWDASSVSSHLQATDGWNGWTGSVTIDPPTGDRTPATVVVTQVTDAGTFEVDRAWQATQSS